MATGTVRLHRVLNAKPERVYKAFIDADAMNKWLPPYGFTGKVHELDAQVGGGYRMSFTNFSTGSSHSFGGIYRDVFGPHFPAMALVQVVRLVEPSALVEIEATAVIPA